MIRKSLFVQSDKTCTYLRRRIIALLSVHYRSLLGRHFLCLRHFSFRNIKWLEVQQEEFKRTPFIILKEIYLLVLWKTGFNMIRKNKASTENEIIRRTTYSFKIMKKRTLTAVSIKYSLPNAIAARWFSNRRVSDVMHGWARIVLGSVIERDSRLVMFYFSAFNYCPAGVWT